MAQGTIPNIKRAKYVTYSASYSVGASGTKSISANDFGISTPEGYEAAGICHVECGTASCGVVTFNVRAEGTGVIMWVRNYSTSAINNVTAKVTILYLPA